MRQKQLPCHRKITPNYYMYFYTVLFTASRRLQHLRQNSQQTRSKDQAARRRSQRIGSRVRAR